MEELVLNLQNQVKIFQTLENYSLEFGIFAEDTNTIVQVNILNSDQTVSKLPMTLGDVMYFTENGTLTIPARPVLENLLTWINNKLESIIDEIYDGVFYYDWKEPQVESRLYAFINEGNDFLKTEIENMIENNNYLSTIIGIKDNQKYLYDPKKLSNFIKLKLIKK